jgi:dienelactone hydrolase
MKLPSLKLLSAAFSIVFSSCGNQHANTISDTSQTQAMDTIKAVTPSLKTEDVTYSFNGKQSIGFVAYDENKKEKLPVVIVVSEWWGLNDYVKNRAKQLAALGYFAIAADMFGEGKTAANPQEAMAFTKPFYASPQLALQAVETAIAKAGTFAKEDTSRAAAIGYCFGGFIVLNAAKLGAPLKGVVSFHGGLGGVVPKKGLIHGVILVCQGGADQFVPEADRAAFKKSMDSVGAHYTFVEYPGATHAFTNPDATANGLKFKMPIAYNPAADTASWKAMQNLFLTVLK